jgi:hypothetical protein
LLLHAIERVKTQSIFDRDSYESRREALPGSRLLKVLVFYQMLKDPSQRCLVRIVEQSRMRKPRWVGAWPGTRSPMRFANETSDR